jgi:HSP20 family protein
MRKNIYLNFDRDEFITPFDRLFDSLLSTTYPQLTKELGVDVFKNSAYPKCDIVDFSDRMELTFEVPGLSKDQVSIDIDGEILTLSGNKNKDVEKEGGKFLVRELKKSSFKRSFRVDPKVFNLEGVKASFTDGVLDLVIPKLEAVKPTKRSVDIE